MFLKLRDLTSSTTFQVCTPPPPPLLARSPVSHTPVNKYMNSYYLFTFFLQISSENLEKQDFCFCFVSLPFIFYTVFTIFIFLYRINTIALDFLKGH